MDRGQMWAVATGQYSDYRVLCVCDSKERAEQVAAALRADSDGDRSDARVESMPFVDYDPEKVTVFHMTVTVWDDGTVDEDREPWSTSEWPFDQWEPLDRVAWRWVRAPMHKGNGGRLDIRGTDRARVRRVYSDRKAQLLAEDAFRMKKEATGRA